MCKKKEAERLQGNMQLHHIVSLRWSSEAFLINSSNLCDPENLYCWFKQEPNKNKLLALK